jgi:hypothetical protein
MTESETSRALHNGSLTSKAIGAAPGCPPPARKALPAPTPTAPHGYTLQFLISIIKNSQQKSPSQQHE